jgi:hypothetical protein
MSRLSCLPLKVLLLLLVLLLQTLRDTVQLFSSLTRSCSLHFFEMSDS